MAADDWYGDVLEFHRRFACHVGTTPAVPDDKTVDLRWKLINEEYAETCEAIADEDVVALADGIVDLIYVLIGTAISCGIDLRPVWRAVHRANLAKSLTGKRGDGKVQKGEGWQPPDVAGILAAQPPLEGGVE
jgi:predicted HAD superfamily Cof-like phosphohydrolase